MGFELTTLVVIGTDCTGSCKSNYHTIMTMMAPFGIVVAIIHVYDKSMFIVFGSFNMFNIKKSVEKPQI
jgi:hypothetical protein